MQLLREKHLRGYFALKRLTQPGFIISSSGLASPVSSKHLPGEDALPRSLTGAAPSRRAGPGQRGGGGTPHRPPPHKQGRASPCAPGLAGKAGPPPARCPRGRSRRTCSAAHHRLPRRRRPRRARRLPRGQASARAAFHRRCLLRGGLRRPLPGELLLLAAAAAALPPQDGGPEARPFPPATGHSERCGDAASIPPPSAPPFCRGTRRAAADWPAPHRLERPLAQRGGGRVGGRGRELPPRASWPRPLSS